MVSRARIARPVSVPWSGGRGQKPRKTASAAALVPRAASQRINSPSKRNTPAYAHSQSRKALSAMACATGSSSVGDREIIWRIWPVAVCCSSASAKAVSARLCAALFSATSPSSCFTRASARASACRSSAFSAARFTLGAIVGLLTFLATQAPSHRGGFNEQGVETARSIAACCSAGPGKSRRPHHAGHLAIEVTGAGNVGSPVAERGGNTSAERPGRLQQ